MFSLSDSTYDFNWRPRHSAGVQEDDKLELQFRYQSVMGKVTGQIDIKIDSIGIVYNYVQL